MRKARLRFDQELAVALSTERAQVAAMTLAPGGSEGGPDNRHRGADQWLCVSSDGEAIVEGERHTLLPGTVLPIERGEAHEVRNTGDEPLRTLTFYDPPAHTADGDPLPAGESG